MDKLKQLESFVPIVARGSLTAAAKASEHLRITAPAGFGRRHVAPPNGIYAVFAQRKYLPLRVRL